MQSSTAIKCIIICVGVLCALNFTTAFPSDYSYSDGNVWKSDVSSSYDIKQCDNLWWSNFEDWKNWSKSQCRNSNKNYNSNVASQGYYAQNNNTDNSGYSMSDQNWTQNHQKHSSCHRGKKWNHHEWQMNSESWEHKNRNSHKNSKNNCHNSHLWKPFEEKMWSRWQKYSDCRCESFQWNPKNPLGVSVCYQLAWYNQNSGKFVGEITAYRWGAKDKMKDNSKFELKFKFPYGGSSKWHKAPSAMYSWNDQEKQILKYYIKGNVPKNHADKSLDYLTSPSQYKLVYGCNESMLQENYDYQNVCSSSYMPAKPYAPALENSGDCKCSPPVVSAAMPMASATNGYNAPSMTMMTTTSDYSAPTNAAVSGDNTMTSDYNTMMTTTSDYSAPTNAAVSDDNTMTTSDYNTMMTTTSDYSAPTDAASGDNAMTSDYNTPTETTTSDSSAPTDATVSDDTMPNDYNTPSETTASDSPISTTDGSTTSTSSGTIATQAALSDSNAVASSDSSMSKRTQLPGTTFGVFPFGLILFSALTLIGCAFVGHTTWERKKYRNQFRRRRLVQ